MWAGIFDLRERHYPCLPLGCAQRAASGRTAGFRTSEGSGAQVNRAVFSPDGRRFATASLDASARIWDVASGRQHAVLRGHGASVSSVDFAADGRRVLTTSSDSTARIWDVETGRELVRLEGHEAAIGGGEFSPDGALIVTFSIDRTARLWSGRDGKPLCTLAQDEAEITSAGFSPDGRVVIVSFRGRTVFTRTWPVDFLSAARARCPRELTAAERTRFELTAP